MNITRTALQRQREDLAEVAANLGDVAHAMLLALRAVDCRPDDAQTRATAIETLLRGGDIPGARRQLHQLALVDPDALGWPQIRRQQLEIELLTGEWAAAERSVAALCAEFPDDVHLHRVAAGVALRQRMRETLITHLHAIVRLAPADNLARELLARLLVRRQPQVAVGLLTDPAGGSRTIDAALTSARICRRAGAWADAEATYVELLREHPQDAALWLEAGRLAARLGCAALAEERFRAALHTPRSGIQNAARRALALLHMRTSNFPRAGWQWHRIARERPGDIAALSALVVCAQAAKRYRLAANIQRRLSEWADLATQKNQLAKLSVQLTPVMIDAQAGATRLRSPMSPLQWVLQRSTESLRRKRATHTQHADVHFHLANCLAAQGKTGLASAVLDTALQINPRYAAALSLRTQLEPTVRAA